MKHLIYMMTVIPAAALLMHGCEMEMEYQDTEFSAVENLTYPSDGYSLELINKDFADFTFEWEAASVGNPSYSVIFYGSDAATELGRYESDENGTKNMLTMPQPDLVELAEMAGIEAEKTGDLYWTVCASTGQSSQQTLPQARKLTVTRDASPVSVPYRLFITGEGTETGADVTAAREMITTEEGVFFLTSEISGDFCFVNRASEGARRTFYITSDGKITSDAENAAAVSDGIYRIVLDFNRNTSEFTSISDVCLYCADNTLLSEMEYEGNGVWSTPSGFSIWTDRDDRYRFHAEMDGKQVIWGSTRTDRDASDPGNVDSENSYFDIHVIENQDYINDSYQSCYKLHSPVKGLDCTISIQTNRSSWNHIFDFGFDLNDIPVVGALTSPEENASIELLTISGSNETFAWETPEESPQLALTSYSVVFFSDEAGNSRIASVSAGYNSSVSVSHQDLESIATSTGIAAGSTGDIWWGVETSLIGNTAMSSVIRHLTVTRMKGVPERMYFTGSATEFGSGYGAMKTTGTGKFEIYTKLTNGQSYSITDSNDGSGRHFSVNNGFAETGSASTWTGETGIYRINISYMDNSATVEHITEVYMQSCVDKANHIMLEYTGNGIWYKGEFAPDFVKDFADTRFFVKMVIDGKTWKLAHQKDFGGADPTSPYPEGDPAYQISFWDDNSDWDYHYKVLQSYRGQNTKRINLTVNCSPEVENYYVYVEFLDN